jgi:hypothetical protein
MWGSGIRNYSATVYTNSNLISLLRNEAKLRSEEKPQLQSEVMSLSGFSTCHLLTPHHWLRWMSTSNVSLLSPPLPLPHTNATLTYSFLRATFRPACTTITQTGCRTMEVRFVKIKTHIPWAGPSDGPNRDRRLCWLAGPVVLER